MKRDEKRQFVSVMEVLTGGFGVEPTEALLNGYWVGLEDLALAEVKSGIRSALRACDRMPRPAQIRKLVGQGELGPDHRAPLAWQAVRDALGRYGTYASVEFDDPVINASIRNLGGWVGLGQKSATDFDIWTRKEFERIYKTLCLGGVTENNIKHLPGIAEQENSGEFPVEPPIKIATALPKFKIKVLPSPTFDTQILTMLEDGAGEKENQREEEGQPTRVEDEAPVGAVGLQGHQSRGESGGVRSGDDEARFDTPHPGQVE